MQTPQNAQQFAAISQKLPKKVQIELKSAKKLFFFAHILHVLHLPRYTLNKILSVNCALLELLCKKIYFTPPLLSQV